VHGRFVISAKLGNYTVKNVSELCSSNDTMGSIFFYAVNFRLLGESSKSLISAVLQKDRTSRRIEEYGHFLRLGLG